MFCKYLFPFTPHLRCHHNTHQNQETEQTFSFTIETDHHRREPSSRISSANTNNFLFSFLLIFFLFFLLHFLPLLLLSPILLSLPLYLLTLIEKKVWGYLSSTYLYSISTAYLPVDSHTFALLSSSPPHLNRTYAWDQKKKRQRTMSD